VVFCKEPESILISAHSKGELGLMLSKKLIPVAVPIVALVLLVAAMMSVGAQPKQGVHIPPGAIVQSPNAVMSNDTPKRPVPAAPSLSAAQPGALSESFDGRSLDAWRGVTDSAITWVAQDGRLQQFLPLTEEPADVPALFVSKDAGFVDGTVEAQVYATAGSPVGLVFRGSDAGYYRLVVDMNVPTNTQSKARIERVTPDGTTVVASAPASAFAGYSLETWQHLLVSAQGSSITVSVNGTQILSATDTTFTKGWTGVWTLADQGASFDNIRIQPSAVR
jgi:Domain of Unknown Function (DUF1080)